MQLSDLNIQLQLEAVASFKDSLEKIVKGYNDSEPERIELERKLKVINENQSQMAQKGTNLVTLIRQLNGEVNVAELPFDLLHNLKEEESNGGIVSEAASKVENNGVIDNGVSIPQEATDGVDTPKDKANNDPHNEADSTSEDTTSGTFSRVDADGAEDEGIEADDKGQKALESTQPRKRFNIKLQIAGMIEARGKFQATREILEMVRERFGAATPSSTVTGGLSALIIKGSLKRFPSQDGSTSLYGVPKWFNGSEPLSDYYQDKDKSEGMLFLK